MMDFCSRGAKQRTLGFDSTFFGALQWSGVECFTASALNDTWHGVTSCWHSFTNKAPLSRRISRKRPPRHGHNLKSVYERFKIFQGKWTSAEMTTCELSRAFTFQVPSESQVGGMLRLRFPFQCIFKGIFLILSALLVHPSRFLSSDKGSNGPKAKPTPPEAVKAHFGGYRACKIE